MKQFWISLPVKNIEKSREFFTKLGFTFNTEHGNTPNSACLLIGESKVACMLYDEPTFKQCISGDGEIAKNASEVLLSIDAQSKEEVDEMVIKAISAGGTSNHKPSEMKGLMYGCVFADIDGHRWNVLYMDMSKMQQS
jgi:uncharacterized protein